MELCPECKPKAEYEGNAGCDPKGGGQSKELWVIFRFDENGWTIMGVFTSRNEALTNAKSGEKCVPFPANERLSEDLITHIEGEFEVPHGGDHS